jgi:hypothetical protein
MKFGFLSWQQLMIRDSRYAAIGLRCDVRIGTKASMMQIQDTHNIAVLCIKNLTFKKNVKHCYNCKNIVEPATANCFSAFVFLAIAQDCTPSERLS